MYIELKKAIVDWIFENRRIFNRANACREAFRAYIYDSDGNYLIGGETVSKFIKAADALVDMGEAYNNV